MALTLTNGHQGMRYSDEEDGEVQSGSATGFSDVEPIGEPAGNRRMTRLTDPVTQILDKIDAELDSLTRSQGSTGTTATDSTVIHKPDGRSSVVSSVMENGEGLSMSQLGFKPSMMSSRSGTSDHDTGIGTSSIQDHSLQHRSLESEVRPLEPGDSFRAESPRMKSPTRQVTTPNIFLNGQHMSDDDKQRQESQSTSAAPFEAKQVDDKFKEILQKRKGILKYPTRHKSPAPSCDPFDLRYKGGMMRMSADEDTQTIRTEDFNDKFQDTMVYSSADEAERIRNLDDDLHSDGGSDTDTLQRKLAILTRTPVPKSRTNKDGRTSPRPLTRPMIERAKGKFASPYEMRPKKVSGPGTPPVYPKPTPTTSLPRPSARSTLKFAPGHASDADSVKTEDFENKFKEMGVKKEESDLESVSNDPIHTKVKQLLKATAKYKPAKTGYKTKHHVRISPQPAQYDKGEDSDDTLCSDTQRVASPRRWNCWESGQSGWSSYSDAYSGLEFRNTSFQRQSSKSSSFEDSSKSSCSLSVSSISSSDKEKKNYNVRQGLNPAFTELNGHIFSDNAFTVRDSSTSASGISSLPSWNDSELPLTSASGSRCTSSGESMFDDGAFTVGIANKIGTNFREYMYTDCTGPTRRRSLSGNNALSAYAPKKSKDDSMTNTKEKYRQRDLIAQEEEEDYPFSKYTSNKKIEKSKKTKDSSSSSLTSSMSNRSSSQESIFSVGLMKQFSALKSGKIHQPINKQSSSSSMMSSLTSSCTDFNSASMSLEDNMSSQDFDGFYFDRKAKLHKMSPQNSHPNLFLKIPTPVERSSVPLPNPYNYQMYNFPQVPAQNPEQMLNNMGFNEARSILPDRFLKSWIEKALLTKQEEYMRSMMSVPHQSTVTQPPYCSNPYYVDDSDLPPSVSAQQSGASTPQCIQSMELHGIGPLFPDTLTKKSPRRMLQRSASLNQSSQSLHSSKCDFEDNETELEKVGALPLKKENSFDKLKRILQTSVPNRYRGKSYRRSLFASNHQNSLPIFLETLSEEEEESRKRSRTPSTENALKSKMRSFLDEEERLSGGHLSSSDNSSDVGKQENYDSASCSCVFGDFDDDSSLLNFDGDLIKNELITPANITIPSIIVSEKDSISENCIEKVEEELEKLPFYEEPIHVNFSGSLTSEYSYFKRPLSPNPDNQCTKRFSEIADILEKNDRKLTSKTAKFGASNKAIEAEVGDLPNTKSDPFVRLAVSDLDDKYLSPSSSIASPNIMSPVTVIEVDVHKLDNQNDSLDTEEQHQLEAKVSRRNSVETTQSNNFSERMKHGQSSSRRESVSKQGDRNRKGRRKYQVPKCLTLKRHYNGNSSIENQDFSSGGDNVFLECSLDEHNNASVQTEDNSLVPIIRESEITNLLENLFRMFPAIVGDSPYFMAHDRAVQCDLRWNKPEVAFGESLENDKMYLLNGESLTIANNKDESRGTTEMTVNVSCQTSENESRNDIAGFDINGCPSYVFADDSLSCETFQKSTCPGHDSVSVPAIGQVLSPAAVAKISTIPNITERVLISDVVGPCKSQNNNCIEKSGMSDNVDQTFNHLPQSIVFVDGHIDANRHTTEIDIKSEAVSIQLAGNEFECKVHENEEDNENSPKVSMRNTNKESTETADDSGSLSATGTVLHFRYSSLDSSTSFRKSISVVGSDKASLTDLTEEDLDVDNTQSDDELRDVRDVNDMLHSEEEKFLNQTDTSVKSEIKVTVGLREKEWSQNQNHVCICYLAQNYRSELTLNLNPANQQNSVVTESTQLVNELSNNDEQSDNDVAKHDNKEHSSSSKYHSECTAKLKFNPVGQIQETSELMHSSNSFQPYNNLLSLGDFERRKKEFMDRSYIDQQKDTATVNHYLSRDIKSEKKSAECCKHDNMKPGMKRTIFRDSGVMSEDFVQHSMKSDILRKFQELVNVFEDKKDNSSSDSAEIIHQENESNDFKSHVISTRSLDFETIGSRKNILQRCVQTGFAKSFDFWSSDAKADDNDSRRKLTESMNYNEDVDDNYPIEEEVFIDDLNEHDEIYGLDNVSYQVGLKYNDENECYDVYGRIKMAKSNDVVDNLDVLEADGIEDEVEQIITEGCNEDDIFDEIVVNVAEQLKNKIPKIKIHKDTANDIERDAVGLCASAMIGSDRKQAFNMYEQIDHVDDDNEGFPETPRGLSPHMNYSVTDNDMSDTLEEIERLYTMSLNDEHGNLEEYTVAKALAENEDLELKYLESFQNKFSATETHLCRNCGHCVSVPVSSKIGATIEHDYCCECSPLNLTADMLEKRRLDRMLQMDTYK